MSKLTVSAVSVTCPICHQQVANSIPGRMAPFIRERIGAAENPEVEGNLCSDCEHLFFTPFLTIEQLSLLYTGYRDDTYNTTRIYHEPGYAKIIELFSGEDQNYSNARKQFYDLFLGSFRGFQGNVVDYGGGDGTYSAYAFSAAKIVVVEEDYERKGGDLDYLLGHSDILFCAHVFEHISQPQLVLARLSSRLRRGAKVFIELPKDYPGELRHAFENAKARIIAEPELPWDTLNTMHEHINHFSKRSLTELTLRCGLKPIEFFHSTAGMFAVLAEK